MKIDVPSKCPCCKVAYASEPLCSYFVDDHELNPNQFIPHASSLFFCPNCGSFFIADYVRLNRIVSVGTQKYHLTALAETHPTPSSTTVFDRDIQRLSPKFVEIYKQAEIAENHNLTEVCGLGYRKALEFLVKDFAIHRNPQEQDTISAMPISQCINAYISDPTIKTLATRSAWLGNDEAHYLREHEDREFADLKKFIIAAAYSINVALIAEDADSISPKKRRS